MFGIDLSAQGLYNTLYKYGYVDLANEVKAVAIDEKILNIPVLFQILNGLQRRRMPAEKTFRFRM